MATFSDVQEGIGYRPNGDPCRRLTLPEVCMIQVDVCGECDLALDNWGKATVTPSDLIVIKEMIEDQLRWLKEQTDAAPE